jgi:hypothetical protein
MNQRASPGNYPKEKKRKRKKEKRKKEKGRAYSGVDTFE